VTEFEHSADASHAVDAAGEHPFEVTGNRAEVSTRPATERSNRPVTEIRDADLPRAMHDRGAAVRTRDARGYRMRRLLALSDAIAVVVATGVCVLLDSASRVSTTPPDAWAIAPLAILAWLAVAGLEGMFYVDDRRIDNSTSEEIFRIMRVVGLWLWIVFAIHAITQVPGAPSVTNALALGVVATPIILALRGISRRIARSRPWFLQRAIIVGGDTDRERVRRTVVRHPEYGLQIVGEMQPKLAPPHEAVVSDNGVEGITNIGALVELVVEEAADRVMFATSYSALDERTGALRYLAEHGVKVDLVPGDSDVFRADAEMHHIEGLPLITLPSTQQHRSAAAAKRVVDVVVSGAALALLSPLFALVAVAIKLESPGPVFFRQRRIGRDRRPIEVFKFRTMVANAEDLKPELDELNRRDDGMFKIPADPRITRVGRWLRRYSFDELPQLLNVALGEMSLVGPRPLIETEADQIGPRYAARFNVRPGITGPWQVLGRSDIPFNDMVKLDYTYVTNWSVGNDVKLIVRTMSAMVAGRGAY
jgi:exopolysaccharide biosynthesis polyprenyl glycosylphosphotransferase